MWETDPRPRRPLLVTQRDYPLGEWADIARGPEHGLWLWRERRHAVVFADFGDLGCGVSGVRFGRALRRLSDETRIFLLSDAVDGAQRVWARANGVDDVLPRAATAIAQVLSPLNTAVPGLPPRGVPVRMPFLLPG